MKSVYFILGLVVCVLLMQCRTTPFDPVELNTHCQFQLVELNNGLTDVIVEDIFTPPVASRIYAYPNIAAYEVLIQGDANYKSLAGQLREMQAIPAAPEEIYQPLSAAIAFLTVGKALVFGQEKIEAQEKAYLDRIAQFNMPKAMYEQSLAYGRKVGEHIMAWANQDGYLERTAMTQYMLESDPGKWKPTPPAYMPAIEPHWNTLRPFLIDSAEQFRPLMPTPFDSLKGSDFYQGTLEVYETVNQLDEEQIAIAKFWDCNPNVAHVKGHLTFFDQKISPGGHWVSITGIVFKDKKLDEKEGAKLFAVVTLSLADAFISCWDEKYNSSLIRPETYINRYIDRDWKPLLQTPAFPEYTSGHSVISTAAASVLTNMLGDQVAFIDSSEVKYGLPVRSYKSFFEASNEAAISRLYGGIHYMPAIENGVTQGKKIGDFVIHKLDI